MSGNIYKRAAQANLTFSTSRGKINVSDLFNLNLTSRDGFDLDTIAKAVNKEIKLAEEESFVTTKSVASTANNLRLDILKDVIATKIEESNASVERAAKAERRAKIIEALANKQDSELEGKSVAELQAELNALD
jgi:hypothetical protein